MTNSNVNMSCSDIDKELKHFVGDLLSDADYQAYVEHLDSCPNCKSRVRSMGSFSNQLWELGDIEVPSDLDSTILFQFDQAKKEPRKSKSKSSKKLVFGVVILIVGFIITFGGKRFFKTAETEVDDAVIVQATAMKRKSSVRDPEAEYLYNQLKSMAASLEPITKSTVSKKTPEQEEIKEKDASPLDEPAVATVVSSSNAYSLHWHPAPPL